MRFTGRISYSLYLWHWPLIIFAAALFPHASMRLSTRLEILGATFLIAVASFYFIERPFRKMPLGYESGRIDGLLDRIHLGRLAFPAATLGAVALLAALFVVATHREHSAQGAIEPSAANVTPAKGSRQAMPTASSADAGERKARQASADGGSRRDTQNATTASNESYQTVLSRWQAEVRRSLTVGVLPQRLQPLKSHLANVPAYPCEGYRLEIVQHEAACTWGKPNARNVAAITGDSHAGMWLATLQGALDPQTWALHKFTRTWCGWATVSENAAPTPPENKDCPALQAQTRKELKRMRVDLVILSEDGVPSEQAMVDALRRFKAVAKHVVVLGHTPIVPNFTYCLGGNSDVSSCKAELSQDDGANVALERHAASSLQVAFVDTTPWFCIDLTCPPVIDQVPAFTDGSHISAEIAPKLIPLLQQSLRQAGVLGR